MGPAKFKVLNRLGISTLGDLLYYFPRRYEDRRTFSAIAQVEVGKFTTVQGEVLKMYFHKTKKSVSLFQITVGDASGMLRVVWFNQPFLKRYFKLGQKVILYGKVERYRQIQMNSPEFEFVSETDNSLQMGRIVPVYPLTAQINQRYLRAIIHQVVKLCFSFIPDMLPYKLRTRLKLLPLTLAVRQIHFPEDFARRDAAYRRLVFDEFFLLQTVLALKKKQRSQPQTEAAVDKTEGKLIETFRRSLPFKLTKAQEQAIKEIERDLRAAKTMNRLLQGDVGSGKTIVAAYGMILSVQAGFQVALMAPTEILAEQHYLTLSNLLLPLEINVGILVSSMGREARLNVLQQLQLGEIDIVVGTHALIEQDLEFKSLGLVVIDEQHKFGVEQRALLRKKGLRPNYLVMTATPIPRTLAMTVYGDLDTSTIKELPKGRLPISTIWLREQAVKDAYKFIREEVVNGRQAYIVYPLIKRRSKQIYELKAAAEMYQRLKEEEFGDLRLGLLHGQLQAQEKEKIMQGFKEHQLDVLVSTTVIEVGIDIPNASVMVIEHAQRFGLSQLHQLRGRIGRGQHASYCILIAEPETEAARLRIEAMLNTQDGFRLAEQDLDIRGPGQFFGPAQHGLPELKLGNIVRDMELMELARQEAFALVEADPHLRAPEHLLLRKGLQEKFRSTKISLLSA